ncbi:MAG: DNA-directed DNA polymerase II small subunit [Thermoplasmatota archaeon]
MLEALAVRGTLVAPDAATRIRSLDERHVALLLSSTALPFVLTDSDVARLTRDEPAVAPAVAPVIRAVEPAAPEPIPVARAAPAVLEAPAHVAIPAPFTPDTRGLLLEAPEPFPQQEAPRIRVPATPPPPRPPARDAFVHQYEVLADVTGNSTCEGAITDFTKYFNDRLARVRKMLKLRREMVGAVPIRTIRPGGQAEIKIIGIVSEVRKTKNGHRLLEIEDETGAVNVLAPANDAGRISEANTVIEDEVIGVIAKPSGKGDLLILERVVRPDVPIAKGAHAPVRESAVCIISDIHFGSKTFLAEDWERFIRWINGDFGTPAMRALARKTKYLIVNGDVVDGVGIFPGQEDELAVLDGAGQYRIAGEQFARIPEHVKIMTIPGNHDLVRPAEPQPALPDKYKRAFNESVTHIGNPCRLSIEGVEVLSYHGRSMDDWITRVAGLSYDKPIEAMKEMVQRRHLAAVYGLRTPIAPEHRDYLVIDAVPDVFTTGHVHSSGVAKYRDIVLINSSCWQSQTSYQKMHGFTPDPGKAMVVELDSLKTNTLDFHQGSAGIDRIGRSHLGTPDPKVVPEF